MTGTTFVLLDDSLTPGGPCFLFEEPVEVVQCDDPDAVPGALETVASAGDRGLHAAGFFAYELGYLMEPKLAPLLPPGRDQPLLWMGLFRDRRRLSPGGALDWLRARGGGAYSLENLRLSRAKEAYLGAFRRVQDYISAGDVYQINLTLKYLFDFAGDPLGLYEELRRNQRVAYGGVIAAPGFHVVSLSPELFLRCAGGEARARPMKGTAARGLTPEEDDGLRRWLSHDEKSRAENLMIVDLLRNDLGRVAEVGSVEVTDLFTVETYRTVHQMTSGIRATLRRDVSLPELLSGLFPCGSVTGAPKVRAMEIIRELERAPRGVYTGSMGMIAPDGEVCFNVCIRTLLLRNDGTGEMGIGSGIVHDSGAEAEFEECLLKAHFLTEPQPVFQLLETLRWERGTGYALLDRHLDRLAASAGHFGFSCNPGSVRDALESAATAFSAPLQRVRLLLDEAGDVSITAAALEPPGEATVMRYLLSERRTDPGDVFLYHKTTNRDFYDDELEAQRGATGCDEVLFLNDRGELTEGSRTNLFVERGGRLLTPPVSCGLLNGTLRQELLDTRPGEVVEAVLRPEDLASAERIYLGNSVRGLVAARPL